MEMTDKEMLDFLEEIDFLIEKFETGQGDSRILMNAIFNVSSINLIQDALKEYRESLIFKESMTQRVNGEITDKEMLDFLEEIHLSLIYDASSGEWRAEEINNDILRGKGKTAKEAIIDAKINFEETLDKFRKLLSEKGIILP